MSIAHVVDLFLRAISWHVTRRHQYFLWKISMIEAWLFKPRPCEVMTLRPGNTSCDFTQCRRGHSERTGAEFRVNIHFKSARLQFPQHKLPQDLQLSKHWKYICTRGTHWATCAYDTLQNECPWKGYKLRIAPGTSRPHEALQLLALRTQCKAACIPFKICQDVAALGLMCTCVGVNWSWKRKLSWQSFFSFFHSPVASSQWC